MNSFIGEIKAFPYNFVPYGWLACNGAIVSMQQYQQLYSVIGNSFGGNPSQQTFALPNLSGQILNSAGNLPGGSTYPFAGKGGVENVTINQSTTPTHSHTVYAAATLNKTTANTEIKVPNSNSYVSNIVAQVANQLGTTYLNPPYPGPNVSLNPNSVVPVGGSAAHENRAPFLPITYCICATEGDYPPRP
ncbi:MAG: phage tail protein [Flavobacteriales bacterium]